MLFFRETTAMGHFEIAFDFAVMFCLDDHLALEIIEANDHASHIIQRPSHK